MLWLPLLLLVLLPLELQCAVVSSRASWHLYTTLVADMASTGLRRCSDADHDYSRCAACASRATVASSSEGGREADRELGDKTRRE